MKSLEQNRSQGVLLKSLTRDGWVTNFPKINSNTSKHLYIHPSVSEVLPKKTPGVLLKKITKKDGWVSNYPKTPEQITLINDTDINNFIPLSWEVSDEPIKPSTKPSTFIPSFRPLFIPTERPIAVPQIPVPIVPTKVRPTDILQPTATEDRRTPVSMDTDPSFTIDTPSGSSRVINIEEIRGRIGRELRGSRRWQVGSINVRKALGIAVAAIGFVSVGLIATGSILDFTPKEKPQTTQQTTKPETPAKSSRPEQSKPENKEPSVSDSEFSIYNYVDDDETFASKYNLPRVSSLPGRVMGMLCETHLNDYQRNQGQPETKFNPFNPEDLAICDDYFINDINSTLKLNKGVEDYIKINPPEAFNIGYVDVDGNIKPLKELAVKHDLADGTLAPIKEPRSWREYFNKIDIQMAQSSSGGVDQA